MSRPTNIHAFMTWTKSALAALRKDRHHTGGKRISRIGNKPWPPSWIISRKINHFKLFTEWIETRHTHNMGPKKKCHSPPSERTGPKREDEESHELGAGSLAAPFNASHHPRRTWDKTKSVWLPSTVYLTWTGPKREVKESHELGEGHDQPMDTQNELGTKPQQASFVIWEEVEIQSLGEKKPGPSPLRHLLSSGYWRQKQDLQSDPGAWNYFLPLKCAWKYKPQTSNHK